MSKTDSEGDKIIRDILKATIFEIGLIFQFMMESIRWMFKRPYRINEILKQIEFVGNQSIFIICLTGIFTGMVLRFKRGLVFQW